MCVHVHVCVYVPACVRANDEAEVMGGTDGNKDQGEMSVPWCVKNPNITIWVMSTHNRQIFQENRKIYIVTVCDLVDRLPAASEWFGVEGKKEGDQKWEQNSSKH